MTQGPPFPIRPGREVGNPGWEQDPLTVQEGWRRGLRREEGREESVGMETDLSLVHSVRLAACLSVLCGSTRLPGVGTSWSSPVARGSAGALGMGSGPRQRPCALL